MIFRRLIQLALLKLDFIDRSRTVKRGAPIVDLSEWLTTEQLASGAPDEVDSGDHDEPFATGRQYWAGGFTEASRLEKFKAGNSWGPARVSGNGRSCR